jgi:dihydrofolate synthase / folylpolyglutamate synthase
LILLFGVLGDKDYRMMAKRLFPMADRVILTRPGSERALPPENLRRAAERYHRNIDVVENPPDALRYALSLAGEGDLVCAAGSLYLVGEVKRIQRSGRCGGMRVIP